MHMLCYMPHAHATFTVCDDCNTLHHGDCPVHGPLKELDPSAGIDLASLMFTQLPVPAQLTVKRSCIPGAGLGVFAKSFIPRGIRVGPYEGKRVDKQDMGDVSDTAYAWEVSQNEILDKENSLDTSYGDLRIFNGRFKGVLWEPSPLQLCILPHYLPCFG